MGYVVLGAGAIGAVVGGRLFQAGCHVTLIARGAHLEALLARGLRLESPASTDTVRHPAVGHPREIDWRSHHVVLMAVKSQQTLAALSELSQAARPETPIVCLQSGITNEPAALRMFPNVQGVSGACPTSHLEPGVVPAWSAPVTGLLGLALRTLNLGLRVLPVATSGVREPGVVRVGLNESSSDEGGRYCDERADRADRHDLPTAEADAAGRVFDGRQRRGRVAGAAGVGRRDHGPGAGGRD